MNNVLNWLGCIPPTVLNTVGVVEVIQVKYNPDLYGFKFGTGDINYLDYGATWYRQVSPTAYHFIRLINWDDACGRDAPKETYYLALSEVDLCEISEDNLNSAFQCQGKEDWRTDAKVNDLWKAEACLEYGLHAPLQDVNTSNFHKSFRVMAAYSRSLTKSKSAHRKALNRRVNKIGSTAREYMRGDLQSGLIRGIIAEDPTALIIAKIYKASEVV